jgi:PTH2 family peptidyl-tRNA hydrolase
MKSKQVIVVRKDLNMRKGKMIAQGAHASMKAILDSMIDIEEEKILYLEPGSPMTDWINGIFTKICVSVDSEEELLTIYNNAKTQGYNAALIQDVGLTEFGGIPTYTCCAIGPNWEDEVNSITGHLKLL